MNPLAAGMAYLDAHTARYWWWDDALTAARKRATATSRRHRVRLELSPYTGLMRWTVREVGT